MPLNLTIYNDQWDVEGDARPGLALPVILLPPHLVKIQNDSVSSDTRMDLHPLICFRINIGLQSRQEQSLKIFIPI